MAIEFCLYAGQIFLIINGGLLHWLACHYLHTTKPHLITAIKQVQPLSVWLCSQIETIFRILLRNGASHIHPNISSQISWRKSIEVLWTRLHLEEGKLAQAFLRYRNTLSRQDYLFPVQKLFGKMLPAHHRAFTQRSPLRVTSTTCMWSCQSSWQALMSWFRILTQSSKASMELAVIFWWGTT